MLKQIASKGQEPSNGHRAFVGSTLTSVCLALVGITLAVFALSSPATAQDGLDVWRRGNCTSCHGGLAQGGGGGEQPKGPNLRETKLDREAVWETIACGRFEMPTHLEGAYKTVPCYGLPLADGPPEGQSVGRQFPAAEIDALVDFLFADVVGVPLTREDCAVFFGGNMDAPACVSYPSRN